MITGTNPPILGIDNDGTLFIRGGRQLRSASPLHLRQIKKKFSTRSACTAKVEGDTATCVPAPACDGGSCAFEIVEK